MSDEESKKPEATVLPVDASVNQSGVKSGSEQAQESKSDVDEDVEEYLEDAPVAQEDYDANKVLQLGDRVLINSDRYGIVWGTIYYRDNEMLRLRPDSASNMLLDFPRIYEDGKDAFSPDLGVKECFILKKRNPVYPDFVRQQDFRVGQIVVGIDETGMAGTYYEIKSVNEEKDRITVVNVDDENDEQVLKFRHRGIPEDAPFRILRITTRPKAKVEEAPVEEEVEEVEEEAEEIEEDEELEVLDTDEFEVVLEGLVALPQQTVYKEVASSRKIIPEDIQKNEALKDFLNMLDLSQQKDPKAIREFRILVETLHKMKQEILDLRADGSVKGHINPSASTLVELLEKVHVPMGRAVLDVKKRLFQLGLAPGKPSRAPVPTLKTSDVLFLEDENIEAPTVTPFSSVFVESITGESNNIGFYTTQQGDYERYERPWIKGESSGPPIPLQEDTLFFRNTIPDLDDPSLDGYMRAPARQKDDDYQPFPEIGALAYGIETALATTYRKGQRGGKQVLLPEETAPMNHYLLFPSQVALYLGTKRSGSLALDMARGKEGMVWMQAILQMLGTIAEANKATNIVALSVSGSNLANISIKDYLEGMIIPGTGIGDMMTTLVDYGLTQIELNVPILEVLQAKIANYQAQLITSLNQVRQAIREIPAPIANPMLPIATTPILDTLFRSEKILVDALNTFMNQNPVLKDSDVARVAYFLKNLGDYYQTAIGKQPELLVEERNKVIKTIQLTMIQDDEQEKRNKRLRGEAPKPNLCEHVAKLKAIRKVKEEQDRYTLLTKFLAHYQKNRHDNWIMCNVCDKELLCVHERLLIKAFLSPREKEVIFKELHLHFSGGVFSGYYICRNCGQPIQQIGYDTNLQFDKTGQPIVGRAELKDKDVLRAADIEAVLGLPLQNTDEFEFDSEEYTQYYRIVREIAERVGIFMTQKRYLSVVKKMAQLNAIYPDREEFVAMEEAKKKRRLAEGKAYEVADYDVVIAKNTIGSAAVHLLLEIQTRIPDYMPQYSIPNCNPSFAGYPLQENKASLDGLTYLACAIQGIQRDDVPWSTARFHRSGRGAAREDHIAAIVKYITPILEDVIEEQGAGLQQKLSEKRTYLEEQLSDRAKKLIEKPMDIVPSYFLPEMHLPTPVEAASEVSQEGANPDARANVRAWIRNAHELARRTSNPIRGSYVSDITCCKIAVQSPGAFWLAKADLSPLPLPLRALKPAKRGTFQQFHFEARTHEDTVVGVPKDLTYRLFTHVCFRGDNMGKAHEIGATNRCRFCNFQFPEHPSIITPDKAKDAVVSAQIDDSVDAFQQLLDNVHRNNSITIPPLEPEGEIWVDVLKEIKALDISIPDWSNLFSETIKALNRLKGEVNSADVAEANADLSNAVEKAETFVKNMIGEKGKYKNPDKKYAILDKIAELPWHNFVQVVETYLITPGKNLLNGYDTERLKTLFQPRTMPEHMKKYASSHLKDLEDVLDIDHAVLDYFSDTFGEHDSILARAKMYRFVNQMSQVVLLKNRLRPVYFVGGANTFQYIQAAFLYGPLAELFNSSKLPIATERFALQDTEADEGEALVKKKKKPTYFDTSIELLIKIIGASIDKFQEYRLGYNDDEIREIIQQRAEKEKQNILSKLDRMSDEQRRVATINMRLGLGRYNVDTLKSIVKYSADQLALERKENEEAGILMGLSRSKIDDDDMGIEGVEGEEEDEEDEDAREAAEGYDDHQGGGEANEFDGELDVD